MGPRRKEQLRSRTPSGGVRTRARRARACCLACAVATSVFVSTWAAAQPSPPSQISPPPPSAGAAIQGEAMWAQLAAYEQYLLYLSLANKQPNAPTPDVTQYFRNGAAVTTVPSAGQPGSAYFNNGAAVTSVPSAGQPGSAYFTNGAEATNFPLTPLAPSAAPPPPPPPPPFESPPWWWKEPESSAASAATEPAAPSPGPPATEVLIEGPPMSFEVWLRSMGAAARSAEGSERRATITAPEAAAPPVVEPSAIAYDERQQAIYPLPEKPSERTLGIASRRLGALVAGAFCLGLLLGALVMRRRRPRLAPR